jgi:MFS transporter, FSR family, fosmidomycin resistance protein
VAGQIRDVKFKQVLTECRVIVRSFGHSRIHEVQEQRDTGSDKAVYDCAEEKSHDNKEKHVDKPRERSGPERSGWSRERGQSLPLGGTERREERSLSQSNPCDWLIKFVQHGEGLAYVEVDEETPKGQSHVDHPRITLIGLAHLTNDLSGNFLSSLTPYLVLRGAISATVAGFVVFAYLIGSSVLQPAFGILSDRQGRKWFAVVGPLWLCVAAAFTGWVNNSWELLLLAGVGGLGTAAFHPQAAAMVDALSPRNKGRSMAIFSMGGNIGFAIGPLLAARVALAGLHWSIVLIAPGIAIAILLALFAPAPVRRETPLEMGALLHTIRSQWIALSVIVWIIALRSAVQIALIIFLPLFYHARGFAPEIGSYLAFVLSLAGAIGGLVGGHVSDLYGRRLITVATLALAAPAIVLTLLASGIAVWPLIAVAGALLLASNSVMVVAAQGLLPENTGLASGLTLGLGFGLSGLVTSLLSALSDYTSVTTAIFAIPLLALLAAALSLMLPKDERFGRMRVLEPQTAGMRPASGE